MNPFSSQTRPSTRAFSLIEILVAVIVLGLGLLGIAALFPVVIREQRIGTDNVLGVVVSNSARALLRQTNFNLAVSDRMDFAWNRNAWRALKFSDRSDGANFSGLAAGGAGAALNGNRQRFERGEWSVPLVLSEPNARFPAGTTLIGDPRSTDDQIGIPLSLRVYPSAIDGPRNQPEFVWDIAVQRISDFDYATGPGADPLRVAIFVRRIDPRIRLDAGISLRQALLDPAVIDAARRLPIAEDRDQVPTLDGGGPAAGSRTYSQLKVVALGGLDVPSFSVDSTGQGTHLIVDTDEPLGALIAQPGQKLVDNLGNIYSISQVAHFENAEPGQVACRLSPPIPEQAFSPTSFGARPDGRPQLLLDRPRLSQFLFSPQIPAGVVLTEINQ